ncbi:hypothetical protein NDU88_003073 [Pleurodeles waltl]|uniref:Uncharacterized protein n=1 Tax=Pleurodeles waltl TaxID=8319 RepID=A0AAV7W4Z2_PLEWA|nr:hypothetical protein NDU88_003073 [Pleurodeles waltl]
MCGPVTTRNSSVPLSLVEGWKADDVGHWIRAPLEIRRTRRGVAHIPLWGNSSSGSTSKAAIENKEKVRPEVIVLVPGQAKSQSNQVMEDPGPQIMEQLGYVSVIFENSVLSSPQANRGSKERQARGEIPSPVQYSNEESTSLQVEIPVPVVPQSHRSQVLSEAAAPTATIAFCLTQGSSIETVILSISEGIKKGFANSEINQGEIREACDV